MPQALLNQIESLGVFSVEQQEDFLDSERFNRAVQAIESQLNSLYALSRSAEEMQDRAEAIQLEKTPYEHLEFMAQALLHLKQVGYARRCFFTREHSFILDRDGHRLPPCVPTEGVLNYSKEDIVETFPSGNMTHVRTQKSVPLRTVLSEGFSCSRPEAAPVHGGVRETFYIEFFEPQDIDFLRLFLSKGKLESLQYVFEDGSTAEETDIKNKHIKQKNISGIVIECSSNSYEEKEVKAASRGLEKRCVYMITIDNIEIRFGSLVDTCGFCSEELQVAPGQPLEVLANYEPEDGSVEFYVVENNKDHPILPVSTPEVVRELTFMEMPFRFEVNKIEDPEIKTESATVRNQYSRLVSYTPDTGRAYLPTEDKVHIKVIMRNYGTKPPCVYDVFLRERRGEV